MMAAGSPDAAQTSGVQIVERTPHYASALAQSSLLSEPSASRPPYMAERGCVMLGSSAPVDVPLMKRPQASSGSLTPRLGSLSIEDLADDSDGCLWSDDEGDGDDDDCERGPHEPQGAADHHDGDKPPRTIRRRTIHRTTSARVPDSEEADREEEEEEEEEEAHADAAHVPPAEPVSDSMLMLFAFDDAPTADGVYCECQGRAPDGRAWRLAPAE